MGLRERRERCGLTLLQLDALTGIAYTRLSTLECNASEARNMYLGTARRIADALHCNVLDLYPDEDAWRGGVSAGVTGLRRIRRERHLTQRMLSALTGIPQPNIFLGSRPGIVLCLKCIWILRDACRRRCNVTLLIF